MVTDPAGTRGYIDPLYHETGLLTKESDVYSFGTMLFEVLCGRLCFGNENLQPLSGLVREYYEQNKIRELVYCNIKDEISTSSLKLFVDTAYQCLSRDRKERPLMIQIVSALHLQEKANSKASVNGAGILNVNVLGTTDFESESPLNASEHFFVVSIDGEGKLLKAEWNEESSLYVNNIDDQYLYIFVYKIVSEKIHSWLGEASLKLRDLTPEIPHNCNVCVMDDNHNTTSNLNVEVLYKPSDIKDAISSVQKAPIGTPNDGGLLVVIIHCTILHSVYCSTSSSVSLLFRGKLRKTKSIMNTRKPMWVQEFRFMLKQPPTDEKLHLEVINNSWTGLIPGMGSLGCIDISLAGVVNKKRTNMFYQLEPPFVVSRCFVQNELLVELHWRTSN